MEPVVREATLNDFGTIIELAKEFAISENENDPTLWTNWPLEPKTQEFFKKCIVDKDRLALVVEASKGIIGYLVAWKHEALRDRKEINLIIIENIYLKEGYRERGLGQKLIAKTETWAKGIGANRISVTAFTTNSKAIKFYENTEFSDYKLTLEKEL